LPTNFDGIPALPGPPRDALDKIAIVFHGNPVLEMIAALGAHLPVNRELASVAKAPFNTKARTNGF
jgi:hypothetical protein